MRTSDEICVSLILLFAAVPSAFADVSDCTIKGDGNGDCRIGSDDFARFAACMAGQSGPADLRCVCYDASDDGDVDLGDFAYFQAAFSGPDVIPGCDLTAPPFEPGTLHVPPAAAALEDAALPEEYVENFREPRGVYGFAGEFYHVAIDLRIAGRGIDFVWARKYRSRVGPDSAQGVGWDYSYNVYLEQDGPDLILHDGFTRHDRYYAVSAPAGTYWCAPEFFREITQQPDGSYVCRFAHGGEWRFHAFDGSPRAGRLAAIADTNGNALTFGYDAAGRLTTITDTLGRNIAVTYTPNGRIAAVTDFIGRQVQYEYYTAPDPDGSVGDLKSVTSPAVTGTPNANDFPLGKTVTYTYTTGESNEALNHNLLTITDAKGQTYLVNEYAATVDPNALDFDRLTRQTLGEPGDVIDYVYAPESPDAGNGYAVLRTIVNDRNGHVDEYLYDRFNRCVSVREYAGQADPNQPTTDVANRPVGKLRAGDPDFFEFRFEYNDDALPARLTLAEQNEIVFVYESDVDFLAPPRKRANLLSVERNPGPRGGDQPIIIEQFEYDELSNFDTNRVTRAVDGRGNQTLYEYDAAGNVTRVTHRLPSIVEDFEYNAFGQVTARVWPDNGGGHRRRDEFTYYASGVQAGYLESTVIDATGLALTTTFEYDAVGNVTRVIDPRGADRLLTVNQLNQVVRVASRQPGAANPDRYERDYYYDENDNVVRVDVQNRDENGALLANAYVSTLFEYDILDRCTRVTAEVDPGHDVIFAHEYDAEGNRTLLRSGEASNGNQPNNTVRFLYDERDLVYQVIRAQTDADQSTTQFDYDGNGNLIRATRGLEAGAAGAAPRVYDYTYDGYDRLISWADPMGNASSCTYDANGNRATRRNDGELVDVPGGGGNITLSEETYTYDAMDRIVRVDAAHVAYPATPVGDGLRTTLFSYSDLSQPLSITDDNGNTTTYSYDTANRLSVVTDAKGNAMAFGYDQNANLITMTETEKSDLGGADETFVTTYAYDGLDRLIGVTDSAGNTHACAYDSRDNRVVAVDALLNETRYAYDGLDRLLVTIRDLDGDGADGDGPDIVATSVWDDNSRVVQRTDANGNATAYAYDALDRMTTRTHADGSTTLFSYNVFDERILQQTANGSVVAYAYDDCGRLTAKTITPGPGVSADTTFETFQYDGRHRLTDAENDLVHVQLGWDSLSNLVAEAINGVQTASMYDGVGNRLRLTYPGGRVVDYVYDELNRVRAIVESPDTIADYFYVGPKRIERITLGNGVQSDFQYDGRQGVPNPAGDFGVKRMIAATHSAGGTVLDSRAFQWDPLYNKTQRRDLRVGGPQLTHTYEYDAVYRLTRALVDDASGTTIRDLQYTLDGAGNRLSVSGFGGLVGSYVLDPTLPEPADLQMNQYTATPLDQRMYDLNGNLVSRAIPGITDVQVTYDYADRVVSVVDVLSSDTATYQYDPLGRRVAKVVATGGLPPVVTRFYYDGTNVIEEQDGGGSSNRTFTISHLLEAPPELIAQVTMDTGGQRYYYHCDDMGNVVAVTDDSGAVVERYEYDDYGAPAFFDGADNPLAASLIGNDYLFTGRRYDPETGWYRCGGNYLDPLSGRFIVRRGSVWSGGGGFGNPYVYAGDNPWSRSVPTTRWPYRDGSDIQGGGGDPLKGLNVSKAKPGRFGVPWVDRSWGVDADDSGWDDWSDTWGSAAPTIGHLIVPIEDAAYRTTGGRYGSVGDDLTPGWVGGYTYIKFVNTSGDGKNPQDDLDWLNDWSDTWTWGDAAPDTGLVIVPTGGASYRTTGGRYGSAGDDLTPDWVGGYTYIKVVNTSGDGKNPQYDYDWLDDWSDTWTWGDAAPATGPVITPIGDASYRMGAGGYGRGPFHPGPSADGMLRGHGLRTSDVEFPAFGAKKKGRRTGRNPQTGKE